MCEQDLIDTFKEKGIPNTIEAKTGRGQKIRASMSYMRKKKKGGGGGRNAASYKYFHFLGDKF